MKELIRKLTFLKYPKKVYEGIQKQYFVVYKNGHELLSEFELKELLLHPEKDKDIKYIFNWEDRLIVNTVFEELKDSDIK